MEFRLVILVQNAGSEGSVMSCAHAAASDNVAMETFLGLPGESEAGYLGNLCVTIFPVRINDNLNYSHPLVTVTDHAPISKKEHYFEAINKQNTGPREISFYLFYS